MLLFYNWPFPHVYFAKNTAYFPFNSWLSFQRLCRLSWGLLSLQWSTQLLCKQCMCYAQLTDCAALSMDSSIVQWPNDRACNIRYITRPTLQRLTLSGQSSHEHEWLWQSLICHCHHAPFLLVFTDFDALCFSYRVVQFLVTTNDAWF